MDGLQNTTFGGAQGFSRRPSTPWYDDEGQFAGIVHQERNWTYVLVAGAGHLVPQDNPARVSSSYLIAFRVVYAYSGMNRLLSFSVNLSSAPTLPGSSPTPPQERALLAEKFPRSEYLFSVDRRKFIADPARHNPRQCSQAPRSKLGTTSLLRPPLRPMAAAAAIPVVLRESPSLVVHGSWVLSSCYLLCWTRLFVHPTSIAWKFLLYVSETPQSNQHGIEHPFQYTKGMILYGIRSAYASHSSPNCLCNTLSSVLILPVPAYNTPKFHIPHRNTIVLLRILSPTHS